MERCEIKEKLEHSGDLKVKIEENSSSVVYDVEGTSNSNVNIKPKEEDPLQSSPTLFTKNIPNAIDVKVKREQDPTSDELELESESKSTADGESESDSDKQHSQQVPNSFRARCIRTRKNQNVFKKKKRAEKVQKRQLLECTLCPESFPSVGLVIKHARTKHATVKNQSTDPITYDEGETTSQCPLCSKSLISEITLQSHFLRFHIKKPYQCSVCLESTNEIKRFPTESILQEHIKRVHDPARFKFQCDICSRKFLNYSNYKDHKAVHIAKQYKCEYCSKVYKRKKGMLNHIIAVHKEYTDRHETFKCDECEQLFCSKKDLDGHVLQTHVEGTVQCKICLKKFTEEGTLNKHLEIAHWEHRTWIECDVCSKVFSNNQELVEHLEVEHKRFFKCRKCFRSFVSNEEYESHSTEILDQEGGNVRKSQLQCKICLLFLKTECAFTTHKDIHSNPSEIKRKITSQLDPTEPENCVLKCDFCPKTFVQKSLLLDHARKFHPNRKLKCKSCEKSFQVKFQLNKHELLHSTKKLLECQVCHKGFDNLQNFKIHERIHKIDKKYQCSQCEKSFSLSNDLKRHMANHHGGAKPFKCDICKLAFVFKHYLSNHSLVHRDERPFSCNKCSYSCKRVSDLRKHQQRIHSENPLSKSSSLMTHPVFRGPHLKYFENLVFVCCLEKCVFQAKDEKKVAIHYAKHKLPKVVLPRLLYGPAGEVFLSKSQTLNEHAIQARYKCAQCFKAFSFSDSLRRHTKTFHNAGKPKRKKRNYKVSNYDEDEM